MNMFRKVGKSPLVRSILDLNDNDSNNRDWNQLPVANFDLSTSASKVEIVEAFQQMIDTQIVKVMCFCNRKISINIENEAESEKITHTCDCGLKFLIDLSIVQEVPQFPEKLITSQEELNNARNKVYLFNNHYIVKDDVIHRTFVGINNPTVTLIGEKMESRFTLPLDSESPVPIVNLFDNFGNIHKFKYVHLTGEKPTEVHFREGTIEEWMENCTVDTSNVTILNTKEIQNDWFDQISNLMENGEDFLNDYEELELADHLVTGRGLYTHHGIYIGGGKVIHYSGLSQSSTSEKVEIIGLSEFTAGNWCAIRLYDREKKAYSRKEVVERAKSRLNEDDYSVFFNNCEHFAEWCWTGVSTSYQIKFLFGYSLKAILDCPELSKPFRL
ncbi:lecithin retinol acyltransferase family protein [Oceanobacillus halophilus]|uniref:LRAT domain-containing protein n=1 Tax=Oceanobacillus halophilus TaxID=930130 RepID=A0A494ZS55_9BACI|nr:lecithin retinol acyltransferase family protein [Oceanobacillus halophilus]RKQ28662.1 hypothetical protein D8M06_18500 [Oceanobacillus halophilus]